MPQQACRIRGQHLCVASFFWTWVLGFRLKILSMFTCWDAHILLEKWLNSKDKWSGCIVISCKLRVQPEKAYEMEICSLWYLVGKCFLLMMMSHGPNCNIGSIFQSPHLRNQSPLLCGSHCCNQTSWTG